MFRFLVICTLFVCGTTAFAAQEVAGAIAGTVKRVDRTDKVVVVKTQDGTEHTLHYTGDLAVLKGKDAGKAGDDTLHRMDKGSRVAVRYTAHGGRETAHEIDELGDGGTDIGKGTEKATKVSVYYTEEIGKKPAHFIERL